MFGFKKKEESSKEFKLVAPLSGKMLSIDKVPDEVFSTKMLGDGVAIEPTSNVAVAPCEGVLSFVAETKHAYVVTAESGLEVMVHIGLDTVNLKGEGFKQLQNQGSHVQAGEPVIECTMSVLKTHELPAVTPIVLTNQDQVATMSVQSVDDVVAGETVVMTGTVK